MDTVHGASALLDVIVRDALSPAWQAATVQHEAGLLLRTSVAPLDVPAGTRGSRRHEHCRPHTHCSVPAPGPGSRLAMRVDRRLGGGLFPGRQAADCTCAVATCWAGRGPAGT